MKKITFRKNVFNKEAFEETVDTNFTQLKSTPNPNFFDINMATMGDFFALYEKFFYQIPKLGETDSHEYLGKTSLEYAESTYVNEQIQELLDEIAALREENLRIMTDALNLNGEEEGIGVGGFASDEEGELGTQVEGENPIMTQINNNNNYTG